MNPKANTKKTDLSLVPPVALLHLGEAMMDGASKYGPYNWRSTGASARVYVAAAMRHLGCWLDGQENAQDSGVHNLAGVMACCAILLDAQSLGVMEDDRPSPGAAAQWQTVLSELRKTKGKK